MVFERRCHNCRKLESEVGYKSCDSNAFSDEHIWDRDVVLDNKLSTVVILKNILEIPGATDKELIQRVVELYAKES
jgi:hypothetical protein